MSTTGMSSVSRTWVSRVRILASYSAAEGGGTLIVPAPGVVDADEDAQQVGLEGETILVPAGDQIAGSGCR